MGEKEALERQISLTFHKPSFCPYCDKCIAERQLVEIMKEESGQSQV